MKSFHIAGLQVSFLGLMTLVGLIIGLYIAKKEVKRKGLDLEVLYSLATYTVISGLIGARVFYVIFYKFSYYSTYPLDILKINDGGMSIHGALLAAFIVAFIYIKKHNLSFLQYADAIAPSIILGQGLGRVGCDVFGKPMDSPKFWGVMFEGQLVHPVQVYEFLLNYIVFLFLWRIRKNTKYHGQLFFIYIILFAINRGAVEFYRINPSIIGWFSISHLLSVIFILIGLAGLYFAKRSDVTKVKQNPDNNSNKSKKRELVNDILFFTAILLGSLFIYYFVQT